MPLADSLRLALNAVVAHPPITSSLQFLKGVLRLFASQGIDTARLLEAAGIDAGRMVHLHERFSIPEVNRLWELAVEWSGQSSLALDRQLVTRHVNFTIAVLPMGTSPTLRAGLEALAHYLDLIHDTAAFTVEPQGADAWIALTHGTRRMPRQRGEFGVLVLMMVCRRVTRHRVRALAAEFMYPEPADFHPYRMAFECPVRFGQSHNRFLVSQDDLAIPVASVHTPVAVQEQLLERRLARRARAPTRYRASEEIVLRLSLGEPTARHTARALGLTEVAFAKRLKEEKTTFDALVDELRHELARGYLQEPSIAMTRLPALLGYDSAREFSTACQRWFGVAPSALRRHPEQEPATH